MVGIAILGYGVVGSGVYEVIRKNFDGITRRAGTKIDIKHILDIREFNSHPEKELFTKNYDDILTDTDVSVVVEVMGGVNPAYEFTKRALMAKKSVVTSNKELVAKHGCELLKLASENRVHYLFEASVGGGIPIIRPLKLCLAANEISEITGILNGTTNYILTSMIKKGRSFDEALKKAQDLGYAERNPEADVEGIDACRKVAILASLITGREVDCSKIYTEGITKITLEDVTSAERLGFVIKLIGYIQVCGSRVFARVSPLLLEHSNPLANVEDVFNGILVVGDSTGEVMFYGKGAGKRPTASAVVADIIDIAENKPAGKFMWVKNDDPSFMIDISESTSQFFMRVKNLDEDKAEEIFGKILTAPDSDEEELAFITREMGEKEFEKKKELVG